MKKEVEVAYRVKDMLRTMDEKLDRIHAQAIKTNGRVLTLESNPTIRVGNWIARNPFKMIFYSLFVGALTNAWFVSDFRKPIIDTVLRFIGM